VSFIKLSVKEVKQVLHQTKGKKEKGGNPSDRIRTNLRVRTLSL